MYRYDPNDTDHHDPEGEPWEDEKEDSGVCF